MSSLQYSVLATSSRANCTYVNINNVRLLIDCGLSAKNAEERLASIGVSLQSIDAILVTHEHVDHIAGVERLSQKYKIPVYSNEATAEHIPKVFHLEAITTGNDFCIHTITLHPFSILHDAVDPVGYSLSYQDMKFTYLTDIGKVTHIVRQALQRTNCLVLEANYDPEQLMECSYSWVLKQRIRSSEGHLSNNDAASLLSEVIHENLRSVVLSHLSENSNTPEKALSTVKSGIDLHRYPIHIECGNRYAPTELYTFNP
jgi:phosphoribosyl 1,2-cyclic phosphodiesterase